ncbi:MAG: uracil-DNA glycosylase [Deltaproteobacteria bacterium]|nr:uracil-DNA glycosylase [Deltaproteobacteria bacterium]
MTDTATLARQLARTLEHLSATWDIQYVGQGPMPAPEGATPSGDPPPGEATVPELDSEPAVETPGVPDAAPAVATTAATQAPNTAAGVQAARPSAGPEVADRARAAAATGTPPQPRPSAASSDPVPPAAAATAATNPPQPAPTPVIGKAQREAAAVARKVALREQAQRWSPATKLEYLRRHSIGDCTRCPLSRTRNSIVFGVGSAETDIMFVGEAPGADEDRQGEPFVGRAGQLLNQWLPQLGLRREDVYITNVLKCRPPGNRDPRPAEVDRCSPFLQAQIRAIEPKVIIALGRHAGMLLSRREDMTLRAMRGSRLSYDAGAPKNDPSARIRIPLVVTYHPAYVLRQEGDGRPAAPGRPSPTEMVMSDLRRALSIARGDK